MSKKQQRRKTRTPAGKKGKQNQPAATVASLAIPIIVGIVVVAVIVAVVISVENRPPGSGASAANTADPQPTRSIPYPAVPRIGLEEALSRLEQGQAVLIDVRSKESYDRSHAVGAISIPEAEIEMRSGELPQDRDLILYCS